MTRIMQSEEENNIPAYRVGVLAGLVSQIVEVVGNELASWDEGQFTPQVKEPARSLIGTPFEDSSSVIYYQEH
jgi:hypothetical protein